MVEGSEVYAVASRDLSKAKEYAEKFNASKYCISYDDLVKGKNVYIATPHAFHLDMYSMVKYVRLKFNNVVKQCTIFDMRNAKNRSEDNK